MSVENDCNIRLTCMLPCACYCLLDACNMHVTCALFRIGVPYPPLQIVNSVTFVSFLSISILLPSQSSLYSLSTIPYFSSDHFFVLLR